jgi:hypothetical protein
VARERIAKTGSAHDQQLFGTVRSSECSHHFEREWNTVFWGHLWSSISTKLWLTEQVAPEMRASCYLFQRNFGNIRYIYSADWIRAMQSALFCNAISARLAEIRELAITTHLSSRAFLSEYRQRTTVVTTTRIKQISMNSFPPSNQSTGEFLRSGSVKRLCQKSAGAAK